MKKFTCREASEIISRQHDRSLTTGEQFWLKLHLLLCTGCRNFQNNTRLIQAAVKRYIEQGPGHDK